MKRNVGKRDTGREWGRLEKNVEKLDEGEMQNCEL